MRKFKAIVITMKKVLLAREKHCNRIFDISTPELLNSAYLELFKERDKERFYDDLVEIRSEVYIKARNGDSKAARDFIRFRSSHDYEYEYVEEIAVE